MGIGYILLSDPMLTPVLDEVLSSLVPLCHKWSESVSRIKYILFPYIALMQVFFRDSLEIPAFVVKFYSVR